MCLRIKIGTSAKRFGDLLSKLMENVEVIISAYVNPKKETFMEFGREIALIQLQNLLTPFFNSNSTAWIMVDGKDNRYLFSIWGG